MNLVFYSKRLNKFPIKDQQMAKFVLQWVAWILSFLV